MQSHCHTIVILSQTRGRTFMLGVMSYDQVIFTTWYTNALFDWLCAIVLSITLLSFSIKEHIR